MLESDLYYGRFINNEGADRICSGDFRNCLLFRLKKKLQEAIYSFVRKGSLVEFRISWPDCI